MKIAIPVGGFHRGNTSEYVVRALAKLGHEAEILDGPGFVAAAERKAFDRYFCVDSGETLDLRRLESIPGALERTAFWFIDYRHNKNRPTRTPTDYENARFLSENGGWVFQSQHEDAEDCRKTGVKRVSWLALGADEEVWTDAPAAEKKFDLAFIGNIWDEGRLKAVQAVQNGGFRAALLCNGVAWKEEAAAALRSSRLGFNVNSWYGTEHDFDVNMRFFETLSCGVPIVTNDVPSLKRLFPQPPSFVRTYQSVAEIVPVIRAALADETFLRSGAEARRWILAEGTYTRRMKEALETLERAT